MNKTVRDKFFESSFSSIKTELKSLSLKSQREREAFKIKCKDYLEDAEKLLTSSEKDLFNLEGLIESELDYIQYRINNVVERVKGSILAERKASGAIYTTTIPINNEQKSEETTTKIQGGIAYGIPIVSNEVPSTLTLLKGKDLEFDNLLESSLNKDSTEVLKDFTIRPKIQHNLPIEFRINLSGLIRTAASLVIHLKSHGIIEVYKDGKLYIEKSLQRVIEIPVDNSTTSIGIRSYPSLHRVSTLHFNAIGFTEMIYSVDTTYVSKNIPINKEFSQLVIDTCDNSENNNIEINYEISVNDEPYEALSPVAKHQAVEKQSIFVVNKTQVLEMKGVLGSKFSEGDYRFYVPAELQNVLSYQHTVYLKNDKNINKSLLYLSIQEDLVLNKLAITGKEDNKLFINSREIKEEFFKLYRGITTIVVINKEGVIQEMNLDYIKNLVGSSNVYISKISKPLLKDGSGLKYISLTNTDLTNILKHEVYFPGIKPKKYINTIKVKATLKSLDKRTVPFISRILVRGA